MKRLLLSLICTLTAAIATAVVIPFSYNINGDKPAGYGFTVPERYDIAILINDPILEGMKVTGITAFIPNNDGGTVAEECIAWTSPALPDASTETSKLPTATAGITDGRTIRIRFAEGVVIPAGGIYAGYSVTVTSITSAPMRRFPVEYVPGTTPGSLYIRSESRSSWIDIAERNERMSTMTVDIEGDLPAAAAAVTAEESYPIKVDTERPLPFSICNHGLDPITSLTYTYDSGKTSCSGTITLPEPIPAVFGHSAAVSIPVTGGDTPGDTQLKVTVTEVNGRGNADPGKSAEALLKVMPEIPVYRPLVEEYTGLWCGSCPAGWVALEEGADKHGSDFVALSYHFNDDLVTDVRFPSSVNSYPTVWLNREEKVPASSTVAEWEKARMRDTDLDLKLKIEWTDAARTHLRATAAVTSMSRSSRRDHRICYALLADGLADSSWKQANYFSGDMMGGKFWDIFSKGGGYVYGLTFNDVVCLLPEPFGFEGSLPPVLEQFKEYRHSHTFDIRDFRMRGGVNPFADKGNLRVVAIILDSDANESLNCISSVRSAEAPIAASVSDTVSDTAPAMVKLFDLEGRRLQCAPAGIPYIRVEIYPDGSSRAVKIISSNR